MVRTNSAHAPSLDISTARNVVRGLQTRYAILQAATRLFSTRDYDSVTMREIARGAACSHTAIYLYFKDKESLLHAIVFPELEELRGSLRAIAESPDLGVEEKLLRIGHAVIDFSLARRTLHRVLFTARAARVDLPQEEGTVNHSRVAIFALLSGLCGTLLGFIPEDPRTVAAGRIFTFMLNGIASTYEQNRETTRELKKRLGTTFDLALRSCISGLGTQFTHGRMEGDAQ